MLSRWELCTSSEEETIRLGELVGTIIRPGDVVLLVGDLGAGKTRVAKGIVSAATGISQDEVVSPTFTLMNRFDGDFPVYHADLYRLEPGQVSGIGIEDVFEDQGALIVEWAEKSTDLHSDPLMMTIRYADEDDARCIMIAWDAEGCWNMRLMAVRDVYLLA
jgi:tRNA threonylcarbamoyladenosine biosynthesis protein TsaE